MSGAEDWWQGLKRECEDDVGDIFDGGNAGVPFFEGGFDDWAYTLFHDAHTPTEIVD